MQTLHNDIDGNLLLKRGHERAEDVRGAYYRDTTAIIHSSPFRRLKHKTQVFFAPSNDHICTRIEHVLHVATVAATVSKPLGLDTELAWAIGLGHDLGHTPFGHVGERIVSRLSQDYGFGPFEHECNSLRVVDFLSDNGKGLNLTYAVRDGIVSHCGESFVQSLMPTFTVKKDIDFIKTRAGLVPATFEAVIVRFADAVAYLGRDLEDAECLGLLKDAPPLDDKIIRNLGKTNGEIINSFVLDIIASSSQEKGICLSDEKYEAAQLLMKYNYVNIYRSDLLAKYNEYYSRLLHLIRDYLHSLLEKYGFDTKDGYMEERNMLASGFCKYIHEMKECYLKHDGLSEEDSGKRMIIDYIAGMTDNFALDCASEILTPGHLNQEIDEKMTGRWFGV
jgi:dGTP triphosphohydrolase